MKKYGSKREIYQDYDLAIKLIIAGGVSSNYAVVLKKIGEEAVRRWRGLKGSTISAVEIRTEHKGVGRLKFSEFEIDQIACLLGGFKVHPGRNLFDFNQQCFNGALVEPPQLNY